VSAVAAPPEVQLIHGPSAFGGGWRRFFHLTWLIATTDYKLTYFGSALGYLWSLMRPLLYFSVLYVVFTHVVKIGKVPDFPVVLLLNVVLFSFFQEATGASVVSVVVREGLVRKMHFPRIVIPLSTVLTATFSLLLNLVAVFAFVLIYGIAPMWTWLLLPVLLLPLLAITAGTAMILSSLYVRFRDVAPIWSVVSQALFYAAPIFYTVESVPASVREWYACNPLAAVLIQARHWIVDPNAPSAVDAVGGWLHFLIPAGITVAICVYGLWSFNRMAPRIAEEL
jgi:ABC-2 type transport system permease protein